MARIILKGISGCLRGEVFLFEEEGVCLIGRTDDCNIKITREQDIAVSRRHCMLIVDPPNIRVRDLFSTNGTYVDDKRLIPKVIDGSSEYDESQDKILKHGDRVSVGGIVFLVEVSSELNPEQSDSGYSAGIYTTKTTKTRLIPFERATTRSGSLVPQEKLPPGAKVEEPEPSETQRLLSMPITEPIPREMFLTAVEQEKQTHFDNNQEQTEEYKNGELLPKPEEAKREAIEAVDPEDVIHINNPTAEPQTNIIDWQKEEREATEERAKKEPEPVEAPKPADREPHIIGQLHQEKEDREDQSATDADSPTGPTRGMPGWNHTDLS